MFIDDFKTLRVGAGKRIVAVAREADLSADTIQRIEKHFPVRVESCVAAIEALNRMHYDKSGNPLDPGALITPYSRFGGNGPKPGSQGGNPITPP